ncbi:unnamed protein product [Brachionus calyciflorus]|uniref:C-type lectin domain-containing protein n=1 Tax=Brachionus calyciflorus TaxID=104777 RepID=A0A814AMH2_9BILA|nr:unnamed protein product [Brachionus calyciflorus]
MLLNIILLSMIACLSCTSVQVQIYSRYLQNETNHSNLTKSKIICLSTCSRDINCSLVEFDNHSCSLYKNIIEYIEEQGSLINLFYYKKELDYPEISKIFQMNYLQGPCSSDLNCKQGLICDPTSQVCVCKLGHTWSNLQAKCKLTYNQGICSNSSDCNLSEDLICANELNYCSCPIRSEIGKCDCIRTQGNEKYWDSDLNKCVSVLSYKASCTSDYMCKNLTELTKCINGVCDCNQPGGWLSTEKKCKQCKSDGIFFDGLCYYFSLDKIKQKDIKNKCQIRNSIPAILDTQDKLDFAGSNTALNINYWISGYKQNDKWRWSETNNLVNSSLCSLTFSETCLNFSNGCYQDHKSCDNSFYYICQR